MQASLKKKKPVKLEDQKMHQKFQPTKKKKELKEKRSPKSIALNDNQRFCILFQIPLKTCINISFGGDWINWSKLRCLSVIVWQIQFTFVLTKYAHDNRAQASYFIKRTKTIDITNEFL